MSVRRFVALCFAAATVAAPLTGCGGSDGKGAGPAGTASASASAASARAADELRAAVTQLNAVSYTYAMKGGDLTNNGSVDRPGRLAVINAGTPQFSAEVRVLDKDYYAKVSGVSIPGVDPSKWLHLDGTRIKGFKAFNVTDVLDPTFTESMSKAVASAEKTPTGVKGTLDLTQGAVILDPAAVSRLGDKARAVPFEATIDAQGRLTAWKMTTPTATHEVTYTALGAPVSVTRPPAAQVAEAPSMIYDLLQT